MGKRTAGGSITLLFRGVSSVWSFRHWLSGGPPGTIGQCGKLCKKGRWWTLRTPCLPFTRITITAPIPRAARGCGGTSSAGTTWSSREAAGTSAPLTTPRTCLVPQACGRIHGRIPKRCAASHGLFGRPRGSESSIGQGPCAILLVFGRKARRPPRARIFALPRPVLQCLPQLRARTHIHADSLPLPGAVLLEPYSWLRRSVPEAPRYEILNSQCA